MKRRLFALSLAVIMLVGILAACSTTGDTGTTSSTPAPDTTTAAPDTTEAPVAETPATTERAANDIRVSVASAPETIDPTMNSSVDGAIYGVHLFEGLMRYKWDGSGVEPGMAESYDISTNAAGDEVWTFHLRSSLWSDGQPVTAYDFEYAYRRLCDPAIAAPYGADMAEFIKNGAAIYAEEKNISELGVKVIDEKTFEVTLEAPCPFFAEIAAFPTFMPIRQDIIEKYGAENWTKGPESYVTNGPFKMTSFTLDEKFECVPNDGYWDTASVKPTKITWLFLADDKTMLAAFLSGEVDFIDDMPIEEIAGLKADGTYEQINQLGSYYVSFNHDVKPLDDPNVRKALTLAIDVDYISEVIMDGATVPAEAMVGGEFFTSLYDKEFRPNGNRYINTDEYENNKVLAQQALADAGYPNGVGFPAFTYLTNESTVHVTIAEAIQSMWKEVLGVNIEIGVAEWNSFLFDRREGNYQIARNGWVGDYNDPMTMLSLFLSTSGNNDGNYNSSEFDALIASSNVEQDPAKRDALLHQAEDVLIGKDWAAAPIYYYVDRVAASKNLKNWGITPLGYKFFAGATIG